MDLILILGPMKSGKSFDLISEFSALQYTNISFGLYQSSLNVRDEAIWSRNGNTLKAKKIKTLFEIVESDNEIVGIDEIHMFSPDDAMAVRTLLLKKRKVIVSGIDTDYKGEMFKIIKNLLELGPKEVRYKRAACEICRKPNAIYTQIFKNGKPILEGVPLVVPDDGTYTYMPVCRECFSSLYYNNASVAYPQEKSKKSVNVLRHNLG